jgi:inosine-uridine nucleoside N-ribohydrolase
MRAWYHSGSAFDWAALGYIAPVTIRIHLDTDMGGDTDDLCALALLLASPEVELVGVTTCADAEGRRRSFVEHAFKLAGRAGIPVATGARGFLGGVEHYPGVQAQPYWPGLDDLPPTPPGQAIELLEANAQSGATVVAIGPYTNLGVLESLRPGAFSHCPVVVMGGYLGMPAPGYPQWPASYDYNVEADRVAARIVFERLDPMIASLNVTLGTSLRRRDLPQLLAGGPLAQLMALQAEMHCADNRVDALSRKNSALPSDLLNFQYDSVACAAAIGLECVRVGEEKRSLVLKGENLQLELDENGPIRKMVTRVDAERFAELWLDRVTGL